MKTDTQTAAMMKAVNDMHPAYKAKMHDIIRKGLGTVLGIDDVSLVIASCEESLAIRNESIRLGKVGVDSGMLMLMDPCYIETVVNEIGFDSFYEKIQTKALDGTDNVVKFPMGHDGLAVVFGSQWGDGLFSVILKDGDGETSLRIEME